MWTMEIKTRYKQQQIDKLQKIIVGTIKKNLDAALPTPETCQEKKAV